MKGGVILLAVMLAVNTVSGAPNSWDEFNRKATCYDIAWDVIVLRSLSFLEASRVKVKYLTTEDAKHLSTATCVKKTSKNYDAAMEKEMDESKKCPKGSIENVDECIKMNKLGLDCYAERAKNYQQLTNKQFDDTYDCLKSLDDPKDAKAFLDQRAVFTFDKTIIDKIEAAQRKYKDKN